MAEISRLAGAILVKTGNDYYLIGDLKEPCNFEDSGFVAPEERNTAEIPYILLETAGNPVLKEPVLKVDHEGEMLCRNLSQKLLIKRNGSVSNRLWNLILESGENQGKSNINANWLIEIPVQIWEVVRDGILRCS